MKGNKTEIYNKKRFNSNQRAFLEPLIETMHVLFNITYSMAVSILQSIHPPSYI